MGNEEINSAELEAEGILREAYSTARAEECPQGKDCAVHFRVDEEFLDNDNKYARLITYVGDHVVVTEDNHVFGSPAFMVGYLLGSLATTTMPPRYETSIFHVGEGAIGDLQNRPVEERVTAVRYAKTHDDWEAVPIEHSATVLMLQQDMIDVSKPWGC